MDNQDEHTDQPYGVITFELASGDKVKISVGPHWTKIDPDDYKRGYRPIRYQCLRLYSDEETYPKRLMLTDELLPEKDYDPKNTRSHWKWLMHHTRSQECHDHDCFDDFILAFTEAMEKIDTAGEDMVEHLDSLPSYSLPDAFDQFDDSWTKENIHYSNP